ncbi:MAG: carboxypeptidase M32, partial [Clostridia bacterium]
EKQLVSGSLTVEDLPAAWNAPYKEYLDIDVPSDAMGVLQDMHWSDGSFGYFPTYTLGSAYAAQFMAAMRKELDTDVLMEKGDLAPITAWLQSHVHRYGKLKNPADLMMKACGEAFDPQYYVDHLSTKVREIENA